MEALGEMSTIFLFEFSSYILKISAQLPQPYSQHKVYSSFPSILQSGTYTNV